MQLINFKTADGHINLGAIKGSQVINLTEAGAEQTVETMAAMKAQLPAGASWASFGIGRGQMPMAAASVVLGGNVRVGLEDNIYLERGVLASNAQLVVKVREIIERIGGRIMSPQEARNKLKLRGANG